MNTPPIFRRNSLGILGALALLSLSNPLPTWGACKISVTSSGFSTAGCTENPIDQNTQMAVENHQRTIAVLADVKSQKPWRRWVAGGDGTYWDRLTGLQWEAKTNDGSVHDRDNKYEFALSGLGPDGPLFTEFLATLNDTAGGGAACFAGECDWRVPSADELQTLLKGPLCASPANCPTFPSELADYFYWSSDEGGGPSDPFSSVPAVNFGTGFTEYRGSIDSYHAIAVRAGP